MPKKETTEVSSQTCQDCPDWILKGGNVTWGECPETGYACHKTHTCEVLRKEDRHARGMENKMDTVLERALHYVECYALYWPNSGAEDVAEELRQEIIAQQGITPDVVTKVPSEDLRYAEVCARIEELQYKPPKQEEEGGF